MGLFSKKPKKNKLYSLQDAMSFVSKHEGYSVVQEEGGYKVIPDEVANMHIERYKTRMRDRDSFKEGIATGFTPNVTTNNQNQTYQYRAYDEER